MTTASERADATPPVLVVQHQQDCPPALFGEWLEEAGCRLDVRHPYAGDPLPADLDEHRGLLVLGGSMGAGDDAAHGWLGPTKALIRASVAAGAPTLGICLGHQLVAAALGGTVGANPGGRQLGVLPMGWVEGTSDALLGSRPDRCLHWNDDVVTALPPGAVVLAHAPDGTVQAARFAPSAWGLQPHPEVDDAIVARWAATERTEVGPQAVDAVLAEIGRSLPDLTRTWRPVATAFAARVTAVPVGG